MSKKIRTEAVDYLFRAILSLENKEECYTFFEDICTINELLSLSQRFEVARMLREQKTYLEIAEKTGASTATISRVNRSLNYGNDGYDMVFERIIFLIFRIILSQIVYDLLYHHLLQINVKAQVADESEELQLIAVLPFGNIGKGRH